MAKLINHRDNRFSITLDINHLSWYWP